MSTDAKARYAAAGFVALLLLSVFWPSPFVSINRLSANRAIGVDELSFLGREAPSWDALFWCLAGLFVIALVQSSEATPEELQDAWRGFRSIRPRTPQRFSLTLTAMVAVVAGTWFLADRSVLRWAEAVQSERVEDVIRIFNRLGGGMNPPMIILFFVMAGLAYRHRLWLACGVAMALAGASAGLIAQVLKFAVGRIRPELWLGPFHYARGAANSFPSGHTVGAFALGGVLMIASRNWPLRITAFILAVAVATARVLAFRHWMSDVVASAMIGFLAAWVANVSVSPLTRKPTQLT